MKVRKGNKYKYDPCLIDLTDGRTNLKKGDIVRVCHPHGCPKPNTMNHCHVEDLEGKFIGLVCCGSLIKVDAPLSADFAISPTK